MPHDEKAVAAVAEFLKERDEAVLPEEITDEERLDSAREIMRLAYESDEDDDDASRCIACDKALVNGELVYHDYDGGMIHAECVGPEREAFRDEDGKPLKPGDPIPEPWPWEDGSAARPSSPLSIGSRLVVDGVEAVVVRVDLLQEYRPSMTLDDVHSWASDIRAMLSPEAVGGR